LREHWYAHLEAQVLVFNDAHIAMVAGGLRDKPALARLDRSISRYVAERKGTNRDITAAVGHAAVRALAAFAQGDHAETIDLLLPVRYEIWRIGGSHAQRDLFTQTLIAACLGAQRWPLARALLAERVALKPNSASSWRQYADVLAKLGEVSAAEEARRAAVRLTA
jgi:tetratricopeptide (TPR) repeat protein